MTTIDLDGSDPRVEEEARATLAALLKEWPGVEPTTLSLTDEMAWNTLGQTGVSPVDWLSIIRLNADIASDYSNYEWHGRTGVEYGNFHRGMQERPVEMTVCHEFGHVLANTVIRNDDARFSSLVASVLTGINGAHVAPENARSLWLSGAHVEAITADLSKYAAGNPDELVAEGFSVWRRFGWGESRAADLVMTCLGDFYTEHFGRVAPALAGATLAA